MISALIFSALTQTAPKPTGPSVAIRDVLVGKGAALKEGDIAKIDYIGKLDNGDEFDGTAGKEPLMTLVGVGALIKGWDYGLVGMREGGKRELAVPPTLGYGAKQVQSIPPNSTLHFTISLVKIEPRVQIDVVTKGAGPEARFGDIAYVNFTGRIKGTSADLFDSTDTKSKEPVQILIGERDLPIGFAPALIGMHPGEKRVVVIPPDLAYGKSGVPAKDKGAIKAGSVIPPNSVMQFTFELVKLAHVEQDAPG